MVLLVNMAADRRRLQGEIDKTLKKVNEGVETFDDVWHKLSIVSRAETPNATNMNQKEKYELELKKEIKKLQRLREQIKTWQSSNDIKDKKPLLEARKNIEAQMERFKVIERETKQKPYSKDALGSSYKYDPLDREKEELTQWIQGINSKLNQQIEDLEGRLEDLNANKKKRMDKDRIESTKHRIDINKKYVDTLEKISEMLKKNLINVKKVQEIKDDVDYYVDNNDDSNLPENYDTLDIFEDLDLDKYDSTADNDDNDNDRSTDNDDDEEEDEDEEENGHHHNHNHHNNHNNHNNNHQNSQTTSSSSNAAHHYEDDSRLSQSPTSSNMSKSNSPSVISSGLNNSISNMNYVPSSSSSSSSSSTATNSSTNEDDKRRRHKSEGGSNSNNGNTNNENNENSNLNQRSQQQQQNKRTGTNTNSNRNRTNSGNSTTNTYLKDQTNNNTNNKSTYSPPTNVNTSNTNTTPPLSQSPFAAVVAGTTSQQQQQPVSFSAAVLTSSNQNKQQQQTQQQKQMSYSSQLKSGGLNTNSNSSSSSINSNINNSNNNEQINASSTTSSNDLVNTQQHEGHNGIEGLDKKLSESENASSSSSTTLSSSTTTQMNSLKSMAENAILNQANLQMLTNPQNGLQTQSDSNSNIQLANLLNVAAAASLQNEQSLSDPNAVTAALAAFLSQQKQQLNLSVLQQQQLLNDPSRLNLQQNQTQSVSPSILNQQNTANQETFIQPILGVAPLGKTALTKEQNQQLAILDGAYKKLPQPSDTERSRSYLPRVSVNTPSHYPQYPPVGHDSLDFLCKLNSDTLFFMFYYMEGTKAQFLAAQALKKLSWRFHTRYMMWFQRYEEPKVITDEYEMGTYVYFDYQKWIQCKKEGFTFEYKYLEDKDLTNYL